MAINVEEALKLIYTLASPTQSEIVPIENSCPPRPLPRALLPPILSPLLITLLWTVML